jgi:hypothetical protein
LAKGSKSDLLNTSISLTPVINVTIVSWMVNYCTTVAFPPKMTPQRNKMARYEANWKQSVDMIGVITKHAGLSFRICSSRSLETSHQFVGQGI